LTRINNADEGRDGSLALHEQHFQVVGQAERSFFSSCLSFKSFKSIVQTKQNRRAFIFEMVSCN
jgi:hypothetical protein